MSVGVVDCDACGNITLLLRRLLLLLQCNGAASIAIGHTQAQLTDKELAVFHADYNNHAPVRMGHHSLSSGL